MSLDRRLPTRMTVPMCCARAALLLILLLATSAQAANVSARAFLDRNHAQLGDTVTLTVQVTGSTDATEPDTSALSADFEVLTSSHSTSFNLDNGQLTRRSEWAIQLEPRHTGTLKIPSLKVAGQHTAPLTLVVGTAPTTAQAGPSGQVFIEAKADTTRPYVGQQVLLTVRLFYAAALNSGSIDAPQADGLQLLQLGDNARYQTQRQGRRYDVVEQHYAVIPQHAGHIELPPLRFHGSIVDGAGFGGLANFFGSGGRAVQAQSAALDFSVRAIPTDQQHGPWLPARNVTLTLTGVPADGQVQVGEPLTLTLSEQASGLPFESLPTPSLPKLQGVEVYPDQPQGKTDDDGNWLQGQRTRQFAVVPQRTGSLTIPEITLRWWNLGEDRAEVASIPAHTLTVIAAAGDGDSRKSGTAGVPASIKSSPGPAVAATKPAALVVIAPARDSQWRLLALLAVGLWVLTMIGIGSAWWWRRRRARRSVSKPVPVTRRRLNKTFAQAVHNGDLNAQAESLLAWAQSERSQVHSLAELTAALHSPEQRKAILTLQRARYAAGAEAPNGDAMIAAFAKGFIWNHGAAVKPPPLSPLYPD